VARVRGSVVKRPASWAYVITLGRDESARKKRKWVSGFPTEREALTDALQRRNLGIGADAGRLWLASI
jgi:hypothetical protein